MSVTLCVNAHLTLKLLDVEIRSFSRSWPVSPFGIPSSQAETEAAVMQ